LYFNTHPHAEYLDFILSLRPDLLVEQIYEPQYRLLARLVNLVKARPDLSQLMEEITSQSVLI
jgi:hypothetical protein